MPRADTSVAIASPEKRFFIHLITKDITLEDAILDLVDNSINSLLKESAISLFQTFNAVTGTLKTVKLARNYQIDISLSTQGFEITDNCGGIPYEDAKSTVFRFGRPSAGADDTLSVYGIGLKRALFKIGNDIQVTSNDGHKAFEVKFIASRWETDADADQPGSWTLPFQETSKKGSPGTTIQIRQLHEEIREKSKILPFSIPCIKGSPRPIPCSIEDFAKFE